MTDMPGDAPLSFSKEVVERFARAWASLDGRLETFERERDLVLPVSGDAARAQWTGHYLGYMAEARELLRRAGCYVSTAPPPPVIEPSETP